MANVQVMPYGNDWGYSNPVYDNTQYQHQPAMDGGYRAEGYQYAEQGYTQEEGYGDYYSHQQQFPQGQEYAQGQDYSQAQYDQSAYETQHYETGYDQVYNQQYDAQGVNYDAQPYVPQATAAPHLSAPVTHTRESTRSTRGGNNHYGGRHYDTHSYSDARGYHAPAKRSSPVRPGYRGEGRSGRNGGNYRGQGNNATYATQQGRSSTGYSGKSYATEAKEANWKSGKGGKGKSWSGRDGEGNEGGYKCELRQLAAEAGVQDPRIETPAWRTHVVEVAFRMRSETELFYYPMELDKGEMVLTSADRGYDIGTVETCWTVNTAPQLPKPVRSDDFHVVFRRATPSEITQLATTQPAQEKEAVGKATDILYNLIPNCPALSDMVFTAAVFQYDGRKLTLYYNTSSQDYKYYGPLLKPLFHTFGCRIWLQKVSSKDDLHSRSDSKSQSRSSASDAQSLSSEPRSDDVVETKKTDLPKALTPSPSPVRQRVARICTPPLKPTIIAHSACTPCSQPSPRRLRVDWTEE